MPIYEYRCDNGHLFEVMQKMSDPPVTVHEECGASVQRVFHPIAVHFKGSGFYTTDYARKSSAKPSESSDGKQSKDGDSDSKSEKSDSKSEKKAESTTSSKKDD